jgi:hypothetical protein
MLIAVYQRPVTMALVPFYAKWLGGSLVALVVVWLLTRRVASPTRRLVLRCIATAAALTPQPLWAPGDGGAIMPAAALLVFGRAPVFSYTMGVFPILAVAALFFTLTGWRLARAASGGKRLVHHAARRWALVGVILPLLALAATSPFLAFFLFGGPIALWGTGSLVILVGAAALDWRAARPLDEAPQGRRLRWAAYLLAALLVAVWVSFRALRLGWFT